MATEKAKPIDKQLLAVVSAEPTPITDPLPSVRDLYKTLREEIKDGNFAPISSRCGCKVSWETYATEEEANRRAILARREAKLKEAMGYDFGYLYPGTVTKVLGAFEVVLP